MRRRTASVLALGFNEGTGTAAADSSGNNNNGTISSATWTTAGKFGSALSFNGTSSWVTVADSNSLDLTTGMTLEAWVKPSALSGWTTALMKERTGGLAYVLYASDNTSRPPAGYINRSGTDVSVVGSSALALNTWTHLAVTYNASTLVLYVNGAGREPQPDREHRHVRQCAAHRGQLRVGRILQRPDRRGPRL